VDDWRVDKTYTTCDGEGWSYGLHFARLEDHLERGESSGENSTFDMARRRRWVRTSKRVEKAARRVGDDHLVVDFGGSKPPDSAAEGIPMQEFGLGAMPDPFTDDGL
jgi:hypothetical protein